MKVFLDTNVLASAFLARGPCSRILDEAVDGKFEALVSEQVLEELARFFTKKLKICRADQREAEALIRAVCRIVAPPDVVPHVCRDESDNAIFAAAKAAGADYLVTGDQDLQSLKKRRPKILAPAAFLQEIL